jgi:hypothetical protein
MKRVFQKRVQDQLALQILKSGFQTGTPEAPQVLRLDFDQKLDRFGLTAN